MHVIVGNTHPGGVASHGRAFVVMSTADANDYVSVQGSMDGIGIQPAVHVESGTSRSTLLLVVCDPGKLKEIRQAIQDSDLPDDQKRKLTELAENTAGGMESVLSGIAAPA